MKNISELLEEIKELNIVDILGSYIELKKSGRYYLAICPFHNDVHMGSFVIDPSKNYWRCYSCGEGGDAVSFVQKYLDLSFADAIKRIAADQGLISATTDISTNVPFVKKAFVPKKEIKAPGNIVNAVYSIFPTIFPLSDAHKMHLLEVRKIDDLSDFFTFTPIDDNTSIETLVINELGKKYGPAAIDKIRKWLPYIPGFFSKNNVLHISMASGLGFLVKDENGICHGIQVRSDDPNAKPRYKWFSSAFAVDDKWFEGGASCGAPAGFIKSEEPLSVLCITEGRFKAQALAKAGYDAIYLAGVSSWRKILPRIKDIAHGRKVIMLCFDADITGNTGVFLQLSTLGKELQTMGFKAYVALWPEKLGKGFDDLYNSLHDDYKKVVKFLTLKEFCVGYNAMLKKTEEQIKNDVNYREEFASTLQKNIEEYFL